MVIIDQFRISDDGKRIYINVHVNSADYFEHVYLDSITIMTHEKVTEATYAGVPTEDYIYKKTFGDGVKSADLVLTANDFQKTWETDPQAIAFKESEIPKTLFFMYVKVKGEPDECTPCALDREYTVGVTFDNKLLYQQVMDYTKQLGDDCTIPTGFTDFILQWNAFKASVDTEHWVPAVKYWKMLFGDGSGAGYSKYTTTKPCGCHG